MPILRSASRTLIRQGMNGIISIAGLAVGLAVALLAVMFIWSETHYDRHIPAVERLYLPDMKVTYDNGRVQHFAQLPGAFGSAIASDVAGVEQTVRLWRQYSTVKKGDDIDFNEVTASVDPGFADMMGLDFIAGSADTLHQPTNLIISEDMAIRLFGRTDVVGESFEISSIGENIHTVVGVFKNWPYTSHLDFDIVTGMVSTANRSRTTLLDSWDGTTFYTYMLLDKAANPADVRASLQTILQTAVAKDPTDTKAYDIALQPVTGMHTTHKNYGWAVKSPVDFAQIQILASIAALIVLIACINYINLATVKAAQRSREVVMRKILGARRSALILHFLAEAAIIVVIALLAALVLVELSHRFIARLLETELTMATLGDPMVIGLTLLLTALIIALAGGYPALVASAYRPGRVLAASKDNSGGGRTLRQALVVFQFAVSITLAIGAAIIWNQIRYVHEKPLGFDTDNVVVLYGVRRDPQTTIDLTRSLTRSIEGRPGIEAVTGANRSPAYGYPELKIRKRTEAESAALTADRVEAGMKYFDVLGVEPLAGRFFSEEFGADRGQWDLETREDLTLPIVVNAVLASRMGFQSPEDAVGEIVTVEKQKQQLEAQIVGVAPDLHLKSMRTEITPAVFYPDPAVFGVLMVRIDPNQRAIALQSITDGWKAVFGQAISSDFLSTNFAGLYEKEMRQLQVVSVLALLGVLIATFGQYGLAAHAAQSRRREVSIRKVLGARVRDILQLFMWQFTKPVVLAMLVAWPLAFVLTREWLSGFVYRIAPDPLWFIAAGIGALLVALLTVAGHALKVARTNPAVALRHD